MTTVKIHQIYYSPESFAALDKGFIPLDNTHGRSDWMEYWPIRQYFLNTPVGDDELVEVTPKSLRLRKKLLDSNDRKRMSRSKEARFDFVQE